jgi:hypothetical protein
MEHVLLEEFERGHVEQVDGGAWAATPLLLDGFGQAFLGLGEEAQAA